MLGTATIQPTIDPNAAGMAEAFVYTAGATGTAQRLYFYLDTSSTATRVIASLLADASGAPGKLLSSGTISVPKRAAWNSVALAGVTITAGKRYWIALLTPPGYGTIVFRDVSSGGAASVTSSRAL